MLPGAEGATFFTRHNPLPPFAVGRLAAISHKAISRLGKLREKARPWAFSRCSKLCRGPRVPRHSVAANFFAVLEIRQHHPGVALAVISHSFGL